jgi:Xaa-Pro aminopeptidase
MLSFNSISAVGPNAAIVHYSTEEGKNETFSKNKIYLLDAGANYEGENDDSKIFKTYFIFIDLFFSSSI